MELNGMAYLAVVVCGGGGFVLRFYMSKGNVANGLLERQWGKLLINILRRNVLVVIVGG